MPFVPTALAGVMRWSDVVTNTTAFRTWASAIPAGDVNAASIRREHLVRPDIRGFPQQGLYSTLQQLYQIEYGIGVPAANVSSQWGARRQRLAMNPFNTDGVNEYWRFPIQKRARLLRASDVEVHCTYEYQTKSTGIKYPTGAGAGSLGGNLMIHARKFGNSGETIGNAGQDMLYPCNDNATVGAGPNSIHGQCSFVESLAAGTWTFSLVYHRNDAPAGLLQIDLARVMMTVEIM